jgi:hypothetical protein
MEQKASKALLHEPVKFHIRTKGLLRLLGIKRIPVKIYPLHLGTMVKISGQMEKLSTLTVQQINTETLKSAYKLIGENSAITSRLLAYAIINSWLGIKLFTGLWAWYLHWRLTSDEIEALMSIVIEQTGTMAFMTTIVSLRGLNVLSPKATMETSPNGTEEIIASGV